MKFFFAVALVFWSFPAWAGYSGYRLFTLDHTKAGTADSTNFTVLLSGTFAEFATTANGGKVLNTVTCGVASITCPADLAFTSDALCQTLLAWEFEGYTATTGQMIAWVKVPTLSASANTLIYGCVGNTAVTTFQGGSTGAVYDSNTNVVYHFAFSPNDSSAGGNNLTLHNSPTAATGEIGEAASFNGINQTVEASAFGWTGSSAVTVSFWNYVSSANVQVSFAFTVGNSAATDPHRFAASVPWSDSILYWDYGINGTGTGRVSTSYASYLGAWTYVTLVSTGSGDTYQAIYLNGVVAASAASSASSTVTGDLFIGGYPYASQYGPPYEHGNIDEFRISSVVRSASWILAEYNNQSSPSTFAAAGAFVVFPYGGYRLFTLDHTKAGTANSTNFTVLLSGTFAEFATTANGGLVRNTVSCGVNSIACPADLVFTSDALCRSPLAGWEFESYSSTTGQIIAWVKVPTLSVSTNTLIYACAGNAQATAFQGGPTGAAFDSSTKVVYHFPNGTTLTAKDSSANGHDGTLNNAPTAVSGKIGGGASFNGVNQTVESSAFSWTGSDAVTVSFWNFVAATPAASAFAFTVGNSASTDAHRFAASVPWGTSNLIWDYGGLVTNSGRLQTGYTNYLNTWTYVTLVSTGSANTLQAIYLSGSLAASTASSASSTVTGDLIVGAYPYASQYGPPYEFGNIDEFRISNVVRSASWILAEYNNQSSPSTFATAASFTYFTSFTVSQGFIF
jgi:hypothetical protein